MIIHTPGFSEIIRRLSFMNKGLALVRQACGGWTTAWALLLVLQGLFPALLVQLTRVTVNRLTELQAGAGVAAAVQTVGLPVAMIGLIWLGTQLAAGLADWVRLTQAELVQDHIQGLIHQQALSLDLSFYEQSNSYDLLHRARIDAISQPLLLLESLGALAQNGLTLLVLAVMLAVYAPWLPLLLIGSSLPGLWVVGRHVLREHGWRLRNTANERRARYYDWLMTDRGAAAEMRLFDLGSFHREAFRRVRSLLRQGRLSLARDELKAETIAGSIAWLGGIGGLGWMLLQAGRGAARLGDLVLCYQAFLQGQRLLRTLLESAGRIYRSLLFLETLFQFLELEPELKAPDKPRFLHERVLGEVEFRRVFFTYPGSVNEALSDFSLVLPAGSVTAIVGHNGAGKSTLIKLLCRLYDPQRGCVLLDGIDLCELEPVSLRRQVTVLFQEPVRYHATAAENIAMGRLGADDGMIKAASLSAGADGPISRLPEGYATVLGKWFGGAELSVGEWQRLALARAFLRQAPLIILDEPTSAMDSWAEADWLNRFKQMTKGHTVLMITHRFTTAMYADRIHLMTAGRITESGTHAELAALGGQYSVSWRTQMKELEHGI